MDLRDLLSVLRARWVLIVALTLLGALAGLGVSLLTTPTYKSTIEFYVTTSTSGESASAAYQGSLGAQQRVQSYAALVKSTDVSGGVVEETGVDLTAGEVAAETTATADAKTVLLKVAVTDTDPARAVRLAEGYGVVLPKTIERLEAPDGGGPALARLTVVDPPKLPGSPVAPKTEQNVAIGLVLGLLAGVGLALLISTLDRRVKSAAQLEELTGVAEVGSIPFRKREDREEDAVHVVPFRTGHSPAAEAFRRLRTNLQFLSVDHPPKVFVLTSSVAEEGKSETSVNLAIALAESGNRVLLMEADLRRPKAVTYLKMTENVGLTTVLTGQADVADVVQETRFENVQVLAGGPLPPNPSELLASEALRELLAELRKAYDYVVIDSPPLLPVTDGALLARVSDGALLVVRSGRTTTDQVAQAADNLAKADARLLGVISVANKPAKKGSRGYYDAYYFASDAPRSGSTGSPSPSVGKESVSAERR